MAGRNWQQAARKEGGHAALAADDAASFRWIPWKKLRPADFGLHSIRQGIERLLQAHKVQPEAQ